MASASRLFDLLYGRVTCKVSQRLVQLTWSFACRLGGFRAGDAHHPHRTSNSLPQPRLSILSLQYIALWCNPPQHSPGDLVTSPPHLLLSSSSRWHLLGHLLPQVLHLLQPCAGPPKCLLLFSLSLQLTLQETGFNSYRFSKGRYNYINFQDSSALKVRFNFLCGADQPCRHALAGQYLHFGCSCGSPRPEARGTQAIWLLPLPVAKSTN